MQAISTLGAFGEVVNVKDGYARNFLIPKGAAVEFNPQNLKVVEDRKKKNEVQSKKKKEDAQALSKKLEATSYTIAVKVVEEDRLFGSVTADMIQEALEAEGVVVEKRDIQLEEPIKKLGVYNIPISLHPEVTANCKVWVVKE
jgi:large subunit ribosomal protein L9